jgi:DNA-directed RNA polymerase specialized sigma24 family protein
MYDFKEREKDIISMIKKRPELTYQEIADLSSVALSTVKAIAARHRVRRYKRKDDND